MTVETVTYISDFNSTYPAGADAKSEGDNHIRNIKAGIKATFPNITGVVSASHTELNLIVGRTNFEFPSGTKMVFYQAAAPTGWTIDTSADSSALFVKGTFNSSARAGGYVHSAGSDPAIMNVVPSHTHALTAAGAASGGTHVHTCNTGQTGMILQSTENSGTVRTGLAGDCDWTAYNFDTSGAHTHTLSGSTDANGSAANWTPKFACVIVATKA